MSAARYGFLPEVREGTYFQLGRLPKALAETLGIDFETLQRIRQAEASYFKEVRHELQKALTAWEEDQKIPVCLHCGSPRVDWIESEGAWKCQDCGAIEDSTGEGRADNEFCSERPTKGVNR